VSAPTIEHRCAPRRDAREVPAITGVRLKPHGADAVLVNISSSGILVECSSRIKPGTSVIVVFEGGFQPAQVEGRVARSSVAIMHKNGALGYHTGIAFNRPITLAEPAPTETAAKAVSPQPAMELPRASAAAAAAAAAPVPAPVNRW
jgi:hypothetical protein